MIEIEVLENSIVQLEAEEVIAAIELKESFPHLPFRIDGNTITTKDYVVGEIQIGEKIIRFIPRHSALTLPVFFEMLVYNHTNFISKGFSSSSYSLTSGFGIQALINNFLIHLKLLTSFGVTGEFYTDLFETYKPSGRIVFNKYNKHELPIKGILVENDVFTINTMVNCIIKSALLKIISEFTIDDNTRSEIHQQIRVFEFVGEYREPVWLLDYYLASFYSANPHYPIVAEYAVKILKNLKVGLSGHGVKYHAFLVNSNSVFEDYIRTVLIRNIPNSITKWDEPKLFAKIVYQKTLGYKSFIPDILVDYKNGSCRAIFDVKNKNFSPNQNDLNDLVDVSDLYQVLFYARQLNCKLCGLIFPSSIDYEPIEIFVNHDNIRVFALSINMHKQINIRNEILSKNITSILRFS